jgi:hypothetical protein
LAIFVMLSPSSAQLDDRAAALRKVLGVGVWRWVGRPPFERLEASEQLVEVGGHDAAH